MKPKNRVVFSRNSLAMPLSITTLTWNGSWRHTPDARLRMSRSSQEVNRLLRFEDDAVIRNPRNYPFTTARARCERFIARAACQKFVRVDVGDGRDCQRKYDVSFPADQIATRLSTQRQLKIAALAALPPLHRRPPDY